MDPVGKQDHVDSRHRIDPERGSGVPEMSECACRGKIVPVRGEGRFDIPAQPAGVPGFRRLGGGHHLDGAGRENSGASVFAAREEHAREDRQIGGGGEQPGMPGDPSHQVTGGIVRLSADKPVFPVLRGCDAVPEGGRNLESRFLHAERREDVPAAVPIERLARYAAHDLSEGLEIDIAVEETRSRRTRGLFRDDLPHGGFVSGPSRFQARSALRPE